MEKKVRIINIFEKVLEDRYNVKYETANKGDVVVYMQYVAEIIVHISADFYIGNHCFVFREMLIRTLDNSFKNWLNENKSYLYPEIHNNRYLSTKELKDLRMIEQVELRMAFAIVERLLTFESEPIVFKSELKRIQQYVCFSQSNQCWSITDNNIYVECNENQIGCKVRETYNEEEDEYSDEFINESSEIKNNKKREVIKNDLNNSAKTCMRYKSFLIAIAKGDKISAIDNKTFIKIKQKWSKEIKMAKVYIDIMTSMGSVKIVR